MNSPAVWPSAADLAPHEAMPPDRTVRVPAAALGTTFDPESFPSLYDKQQQAEHNPELHREVYQTLRGRSPEQLTAYENYARERREQSAATELLTHTNAEVAGTILKTDGIVHQVTCFDEGVKPSEYDSKTPVKRGPDLLWGSADLLSNINHTILGDAAPKGFWPELPSDEAYVVEIERAEPGPYRHFALTAANVARGDRRMFGYFLNIPSSETAIIGALRERPNLMGHVLFHQYGVDRTNDAFIQRNRELKAQASYPKDQLPQDKFRYRLSSDVHIVNEQIIRMPLEQLQK